MKQLTDTEALAILRKFKRQKCAEARRTCTSCPKRYGNLCFAAKTEICLN